jgi:hypothetical protein
MTHFKKIAATVATLGVTSALLIPAIVFGQQNAAGTLTTADLGTAQIKSTLKLGNQDIRTTAANIINAALGFLGIIAVVIVLVGGFKYMIAGGNEEKTSEARKLIVSGIIGLAIILSAWAITSFVIGRLVSSTTGTEQSV